MIEYSKNFEGQEQDIIDLFSNTFSASEGLDEGERIRIFVRNLLDSTSQQDLYVFTATENRTLIGGAIFSRLTYSSDPRTVFILSPMAVATDRQGQGIGQALLTHALAALREDGVDVAITYGDPAFYGKVGFLPLGEAIAPPPLPLSQPEGWIGQPLTEATLTPLKGECTCVAALNDPALW